MAKRNRKVQKLRAYRDKLMMRVTNLETDVRHTQEVMREIRKALQEENLIRAYALAANDETQGSQLALAHVEKNQIVAELALVYRFLSVERKYTEDIQRAAQARDFLRVAALTADHMAESIAHDSQLSEWSKTRGYTRSLRNEDGTTIV